MVIAPLFRSKKRRITLFINKELADAYEDYVRTRNMTMTSHVTSLWTWTLRMAQPAIFTLSPEQDGRQIVHGVGEFDSRNYSSGGWHGGKRTFFKKKNVDSKTA